MKNYISVEVQEPFTQDVRQELEAELSCGELCLRMVQFRNSGWDEKRVLSELRIPLQDIVAHWFATKKEELESGRSS